MLETAILFKEVFNRYEIIDPLYTFKPSEDDWMIAQALCDCLALFYDVTQVFSMTQ